MSQAHRWGVAVAGFFLQMELGSVYAWSVFKAPLTRQYHWASPDVTFAFAVAIFVLGITACLGGVLGKRMGSQPVAVLGGVLFGLGLILSSFTGSSLGWLYFTFGVVGGAGMGLGYITAVAVLVRWFPDRRGFITGMSVCGFGAGALIAAPLAERWIRVAGTGHTFLWLGLGCTALGLMSGIWIVDPPEHYQPAGWKPSMRLLRQRTSYPWTLVEALGTWQWWLLWLLLFLNTSAGISVIAQEVPIFVEFARVTPVVAAAMVGVVSIGNAAGRFFWAGLSDVLTRRWTFVLLFAFQVYLFWMLPRCASDWSVTVVTFLILLCYGGGFGVMPAFVADSFGDADFGSIYGLMLTAWSAASVVGPMLTATLHESTGSFRSSLRLITGVVAISALLPTLMRQPRMRRIRAAVPLPDPDL